MHPEPYTEPWITTEGWDELDINGLTTPCYVVSEKHLEHNLNILKAVMDQTGCKILMAMKCFSMYPVFSLVAKYLPGSEASSVNEARLGFEEFGPEVHTFSPSYTNENIHEYMKYSSHLSFNSFSQWRNFRSLVLANEKKVSCGIRVNPEHRETEVAMYDPCAPYSHFGVTEKEYRADELDGLEGLHFHTLCERDADSFQRTLEVFEKKFGRYLEQMKWVNFGGGHHITRPGYDIELLVNTINSFKSRYPHLDIYLEPGEAIALNAGVLVSTVIDTLYNDVDIAVLDASATCHMPDVLEIPYRPAIFSLHEKRKTKNEKPWKLAGPTCLTGDVIGTYDFPEPLKAGDRLMFMNMAIYTMVKSNTFNGIDLPSIYIWKKDGSLHKQKSFGYQDFKSRLG
jgi:carboxynorspermidine decarboxylase